MSLWVRGQRNVHIFVSSPCSLDWQYVSAGGCGQGLCALDCVTAECAMGPARLVRSTFHTKLDRRVTYTMLPQHHQSAPPTPALAFADQVVPHGGCMEESWLLDHTTTHSALQVKSRSIKCLHCAAIVRGLMCPYQAIYLDIRSDE
jgi:hypothetical protein